MNRLRMLVLSARRLRILAVVGLVLMPVLIAASFTTAQRESEDNLHRIKAAVVNFDEPVRVDGQLVPLGRVLVARLTEPGVERTITWTLTDEATAREGLADGDFATVLTIPESFSAAATSLAADDPAKAVHAELDVMTSPSAGVVDPAIGSAVASAATSALNTQLVRTFVENIYVGFSTLHDELGKAADGSGELTGGITELAGGLTTLGGGADRLVVGLGDLAGGADRLASGSARLAAWTDELADGSRRLAAGADELAEGAGRLAGGLERLRAGTAGLPSATRQLAEGADAVADGNEQLAAGTAALADGVHDAVDGVVPVLELIERLGESGVDPAAIAEQLSAGLRAAAEQCREREAPAEVCDALAPLTDLADRLDEAVAGLPRGDADLTDGLDRLLGAVDEAAAGSARLAEGARGVADGADQLADGMPALARGAEEAARGGRQVADGADALAGGAGELAGGAGRLAAGTRELADGSARLAAGAATAAGGADALADGAGTAADGAATLAGGSATLTDGLRTAVGEIPDHEADDRAKLAGVAAEPVKAAHAEPLGATLAAAYFTALALAIAGLVFFLVRPAVPRGAVAARANALRLALAAYRPAVVSVLGQAAALTAVLTVVLDLGAATAAGFGATVVLVGSMFAAVNQALAAAFGGLGRFAGLAVLALSAPAALISTAPDVVKELVGLTPLAPAIGLLRAVLGSAAVSGGDVLALVLWLGAGLVGTVLAITRQRSVSPRRLAGLWAGTA